MLQKKDVLIIGGGVIGLSCAAELSRRGVSVTVIDKGDMGYGCSYGNAGWITPCFALPLPMPGMLLKSIGWLFDPGSPLYIKPQPSWLLLKWLWRFMRSMNHRLLVESVAALTEISKYSLHAYQEMNQQYPGVFGFEQKGLLMVGQTSAGVAAAVHEMELVASHGIPGRMLTADEARDLEPALTGPMKGGVYFPKEAHAEPLAVVKILKEIALKNGTEILPRVEVYDFQFNSGRLQKIFTTRGEIQAERYVLATGSWSTKLAQQLALRVPVLGGKGYAVIVPPFAPTPKIPMMLVEKKIAVTPRQDSVRLAGTLELVNQDDSITPRRVQAILSGAREFMNVPEHPEIREVWRGLRPCTPDGVPIISRSLAYDNLFIAAGHQMLGLQSAPGTGRLLADLVTDTPPAFDPKPFRAERF